MLILRRTEIRKGKPDKVTDLQLRSLNQLKRLRGPGVSGEVLYNLRKHRACDLNFMDVKVELRILDKPMGPSDKVLQGEFSKPVSD